jgi:protoporphyrin/coproporphyrin ferrochelatase
MLKKTAVVLMNLGGPDSPEAVKPFLFNLFSDKAIIRLPLPLRWLLAKWISYKREKEATEIYQSIGGRSPILPETLKQAQALEQELLKIGDNEREYKAFIMMRYWHPMVRETFSKVIQYGPDEVVLLPLYPQFSTTTTLSSFNAWDMEAKKYPVCFSTHKIFCYHIDPLFIQAHVGLLAASYQEALKLGNVRVLFSAHGLPKKIIEQGDPYQAQIEATCKEIVKTLGIKELDWRVCYQSKVGRLEWLGPSTESEIDKAGQEFKVIVVVPVAFVSEHSETLVELDILYKERALNAGAKGYIRVPALGTEKPYIETLARLVMDKKNKSCIVADCSCKKKVPDA